MMNEVEQLKQEINSEIIKLTINSVDIPEYLIETIKEKLEIVKILNIDIPNTTDSYKIETCLIELIKQGRNNVIMSTIKKLPIHILRQIDIWYLIACAEIRGNVCLVSYLKLVCDEYDISITERDMFIRFGWAESHYNIFRQEECDTIRRTTSLGYHLPEIERRYRNIIQQL